MFDAYLKRWKLTPDGPPIHTRCSRLLPVWHCAMPAMLKIPLEAEEKAGHALMHWWDGEGAARVLAHDTDALLLERAEGPQSLAGMARSGRDEEATRILCRTAARLHAPRTAPPPVLVPLVAWFAELWPASETEGGILARSAVVARKLLASPEKSAPLHGDIHHDNVLDFGPRGWLAIDPKGLIGERGFDYANIFCNPDHAVATAPGRFERRLAVVAQESGLPPLRLLQWTLAWAGLSAAWSIGEGRRDSARTALAIASIAASALDD